MDRRQRYRIFLPGLLAGLSAAAGSAQVTLDQLTELARTRAAELRPELEKKLAPFLDPLAKDPKSEFVAVKEAIEAVRGLGDSITPLLLEKLQPRQENPRNRNLAANCAAILAQMDPASFLDTLLDIAQGENYTGIGLAIPLLGSTGSPRAGVALTTLLDRLDANHARLAVLALTDLKHPGAVLKLAKGLPYKETTDERLVCRYLAAIGSPKVAPDVLRALGAAKRTPDIMRYIRLLGDCVRGDAQVAHAILPFFQNQKLDSLYWTQIAEVLATVAPPGDKKTIDALREIVKNKNPGPFELRVAQTLKALGDRTGPEILRRNLIRLTKSSRGSRQHPNWSNLGEYYMLFGDYRSAVSAFSKATRITTNDSVKSALFLKIAAAQARRGNRTKEVHNALRDSGATYERIMKAAAEDPELAKALERPRIKKFMEAFNK